MNGYALLSLLAAVLGFGLGVFILALDSRSLLHRLFFLLSLVLSALSFLEFAYRQSQSWEIAQFWMRVAIFWPLEIPLLIHCVLVFCQSKLLRAKVWFLILLYGPALAIIAVDLITSRYNGGVIWSPWGWTYGIPQDRLMWYLVGIWSNLLALSAPFFCLGAYLRLRRQPGPRKDQALTLFLGLLIPILASVVCNGFLPEIGVRIPEVAFSTMTLGLLVMGYGIWRYGLFRLTPARAAEEILSTMSNFLFLVDREKQIVAANQAALRILGYSETELVGRLAGQILPEYTPQEEEGPGRETVIRRKDGLEIPVLLATSPILQQQSGQIGWVCVGSDIRERKQAEARQGELLVQLERSNRELQRFAYVVSHDLKAPLRGLDSLSRWLIEDCGPTLSEKGQQLLTLLRGRVERMDQLIEGILQYSRAGKLAERSEVELNLLLREVLDGLAISPRIQVEVSPLPILQGDRTALFQVFQNLLSNAAGCLGKEEGSIRVRADSSGEGWTFDISDSGPGIAEADQERIFQLFQTAGKGGSGIGLAIVKRIVESQGGRIWLESKLGEGTTFFFTWPASEKRL
ncbi:MAG: ATP-binding protein [Coprothermobacterota bacterium]|nr:ATP-binding protein [Coprothermobacterota bacterium]